MHIFIVTAIMTSVPHVRVTFWMEECAKATLRLVKSNNVHLKDHNVTNEFQNNMVFSKLRVLSCKRFRVMIF